jgi:hypothetical protein
MGTTRTTHLPQRHCRERLVRPGSVSEFIHTSTLAHSSERCVYLRVSRYTHSPWPVIQWAMSRGVAACPSLDTLLNVGMTHMNDTSVAVLADAKCMAINLNIWGVLSPRCCPDSASVRLLNAGVHGSMVYLIVSSIRSLPRELGFVMRDRIEFEACQWRIRCPSHSI